MSSPGRTFNDAAILIVPDVPATLEFGIDLMTYETGTRFLGVSLIPPGLHFIHHSVGMGIKQGFFFYADKGNIVIRPWDSSEEEIQCTNTLSEESSLALCGAVHRGELNSQLGPYPVSQHHTVRFLDMFTFLYDF